LVVSSPSVPYPALVRYAWSAYPDTTNLYNRAGLPASPFRAPVPIAALPTATIQINGGNIQLGGDVPANVTGWLEYTDDLTGQSWTPLDVPLTGDGSVQSVTKPIGGVSHRFYRWSLSP